MFGAPKFIGKWSIGDYTARAWWYGTHYDVRLEDENRQLIDRKGCGTAKQLAGVLLGLQSKYEGNVES